MKSVKGELTDALSTRRRFTVWTHEKMGESGRKVRLEEEISEEGLALCLLAVCGCLAAPTLQEKLGWRMS